MAEEELMDGLTLGEEENPIDWEENLTGLDDPIDLDIVDLD